MKKQKRRSKTIVSVEGKNLDSKESSLNIKKPSKDIKLSKQGDQKSISTQNKFSNTKNVKLSKRNIGRSGPISIESQKSTLISDKIGNNTSIEKEMSEKKTNILEWYDNFVRSDLKDYAKILKLPKYLSEKDPDIEAQNEEANDKKSRYDDVLAIDKTRVILKRTYYKDNDGENKKTDFIHANWVTQEKMKNKFILCQGPTSDSVDDMWEMIFQENVGVIVQLCNFIELGETKCNNYLPKKEETFGVFKVAFIQDINIDIENTIIREYEITAPDNKKVKTTHFLVQCWPDHLVPKCHLFLVKLLQESKRIAGDKVIVTHCSAGIGRSGTYAALEYLYVGMIERKITEPMIFIKEMRYQRHGAVQSYIQYLYCLISLVELFILNGYLKKDERYNKLLDKYKSYYRKMCIIIERKTKAKADKKKKDKKRTPPRNNEE
uniref:Protein-tyrosine-phosphatase n=1 Tax=Strongyloides stercoralis TaxID=6248 RepID=A0A0K0EHQ1_STRER